MHAHAGSKPAATSCCHEARDFGEQVGPAAREGLELGHRGGFLVGRKVTPPGAMPRLPRQLRDEDTVSLRTIIEHAF